MKCVLVLQTTVQINHTKFYNR